MKCKKKDNRYKVVPYRVFMDYLEDQRCKLKEFIEDLDDNWDAFQKQWLADHDLNVFDHLVKTTKDGDKKDEK